MRNTLVIGLMAVAALSQASTFTTIAFSTDRAGVTATYSQPTADSYMASLVDATGAPGVWLTPDNPLLDVAWVFDFSTLVGYKSVDLTMHFVGENGTVTVYPSEDVFDRTTNPWATVLSQSTEVTAGQSGEFTVNVPLDQWSKAVKDGEVAKDILFYADGAIRVLDIQQDFHPVPEPASMLALGAGFAALIARRRR